MPSAFKPKTGILSIFYSKTGWKHFDTIKKSKLTKILLDFLNELYIIILLANDNKQSLCYVFKF